MWVGTGGCLEPWQAWPGLGRARLPSEAASTRGQEGGVPLRSACHHRPPPSWPARPAPPRPPALTSPAHTHARLLPPQVRECATALLQVAKRERIPVFLVGHVTKSGDLAGGRGCVSWALLPAMGPRRAAMRAPPCRHARPAVLPWSSTGSKSPNTWLLAAGPAGPAAHLLPTPNRCLVFLVQLPRHIPSLACPHVLTTTLHPPPQAPACWSTLSTLSSTWRAADSSPCAWCAARA